MPYLGNPPAEAYSSVTKDSFSGDGSTTAFTLSVPSTTNNMRVVVENVIQDPTVAYTVSGTTLTFTSAPPTGTNNIYAVNLGPAVQTTEPPSTIANATTFSSNLTVQGAFTSVGIDDNADATAITIDSSENVLVGKTSTAFGTAGTVIKPTTGVTITRSAADPLALNRLSTDGEIIGLYKDGTAMGSIGSLNSARDLHVNSTGGILTLESNFSSTERIILFGNTYFGPRATDNNAVDLGRSVSQFKDLYLSGAVYLGGTGSSNALDDYEEGTWTPQFGGVTSPVYSEQFGFYTKIGNVCQVVCNLKLSSGSVSGTVGIDNLPFSGKTGSGFYQIVQLNLENMASSLISNNFVGILPSGSSTVYLYYNNGGTSGMSTMPWTSIFASTSRVRFTTVYTTNA